MDDDIKYSSVRLMKNPFDPNGPLTTVFCTECGTEMPFSEKPMFCSFCKAKLVYPKEHRFAARVHDIISNAEQDRFALIIRESDVDFVKKHLDLFPCSLTKTTGILCKRNDRRTFYHMTSKENIRWLVNQGFQNSTSTTLSFGDGVYAYPTLETFLHLGKEFALIELKYRGDYYESLVNYDKEDWEQGECVLEANSIYSLKFDIITPDKLVKLKELLGNKRV